VVSRLRLSVLRIIIVLLPSERLERLLRIDVAGKGNLLRRRFRAFRWDVGLRKRININSLQEPHPYNIISHMINLLHHQ